MSIFLYAYTLSDAPHDLEDMVGVDRRNIFMVTFGRVSAVVSAFDSSTLPLNGSDIFAHQHVQRQLMDQATVIPLPYGLTLRDLSKVEEVLMINEERLFSELSRLFRKVEMEVTMRFDVEDLFDHMCSKYPHLADERAKVVNGRLLYFLGDRAKKGEKFQTLLRKEKEIYASKAKAILGPWCAAITESKLPCAEEDVVTFNCLVNRERLRVFERAIYEAGDRFAPDFSFSFNGPWAPQNFSDASAVAYS